MTAHAMAGDEDKSLQAGMNGHVTKPIDPDQLFATPAEMDSATVRNESKSNNRKFLLSVLNRIRR